MRQDRAVGYLAVAVVYLALLIGSVRSFDNCLEVKNWKHLKKQIDQTKGSLVFCPFDVLKPSRETILVNRNGITLTCVEPKMCIIRGPGNHFNVKGDRFVLEGLVLRDATETSIVYASAPTSNHVLHNCAFLTNYLEGAVKVEKGNSLIITGCLFQDNRSRQNGGAVAFYGNSLVLEKSTFIENMALTGGAVYIGESSNDDQSVMASSTKFISNVAADATKQSGAVSIPSLIILSSRNGMSGINNEGCDGVFDRSIDACRDFPDDMTPPQFKLGQLSSTTIYGIKVSEGLSLRLIAQSGMPIIFPSNEAAHQESKLAFHSNPDGAHIFRLPDDDGYVYVSNSEEPNKKGGVYGLEFDRRGFIRNYQQLLKRTSRNCNGGSTPWQTWVSCEEVPDGQCWQVDPTGAKQPSAIQNIGTGSFEAFATDSRDARNVAFFVTEDESNGALRRYRPPSGSEMHWPMLHDPEGTLDFLEFIPGTQQFRWTTSFDDGRRSAFENYQFTEGIAHHEGLLMFVSKTQNTLFRLDLDAMTYTTQSTFVPGMSGRGSFGSGPDHLLAFSDGVLYFTEDGGESPGIYVYDGFNYKTLLEATSADFVGDETTGIAFSPDQRFMIFCLQQKGQCFQASRIDGQPFGGRHVLKWKYRL
jgi:uncharacterized protein